MPIFRSILFWLHLVAGTLAGVVILVMCVTGVALTYEKQVLEWADRRAHPWAPPPDGARPLSPETLLAAVAVARPGVVPTGLTRRADPAAPVTVTFDGNQAVLVHPYTGAILGEPAAGLRSFFRATTNLHRRLALEGASRATGRLVTGVANLVFLFLVLSGLYLWLPRLWKWTQFKQILWFRRGLPEKARDFNWHNVVGVWSALPLALVVAGAVPISFPWASDLIYRMAGEAPPVSPSPASGRGGVGGPSATGETVVRAQQPRAHVDRAAPTGVALAGLDPAWAAALSQVPGWRSMTVRRGGTPTAPFVISIEQGYGGQPQLRTTLTIDQTSAQVVKAETFGDLGAGRRARSWLRFVHTGEYYGLTGQTIAGLVSVGGAMLVYTGIALALRRLWAWRRRLFRVPESRAA